uniref:Uncharacterized protein n=1 Tax=Romanomermis culicivorax TaxID=13658 RepID=A0A915JMX8_ROMCU
MKQNCQSRRNLQTKKRHQTLPMLRKTKQYHFIAKMQHLQWKKLGDTMDIVEDSISTLSATEFSSEKWPPSRSHQLGYCGSNGPWKIDAYRPGSSNLMSCLMMDAQCPVHKKLKDAE